jgi:hypothetical protein
VRWITREEVKVNPNPESLFVPTEQLHKGLSSALDAQKKANAKDH